MKETKTVNQSGSYFSLSSRPDLKFQQGNLLEKMNNEEFRNAFNQDALRALLGLAFHGIANNYSDFKVDFKDGCYFVTPK